MQAIEEEDEEEEEEEKEDEASRARTRETTKTCNISNSQGESNTSARCSSFTGGAFRCSFTIKNYGHNVNFPYEITAFMLSGAELR